jgi:hypothetical protein
MKAAKEPASAVEIFDWFDEFETSSSKAPAQNAPTLWRTDVNCARK